MLASPIATDEGGIGVITNARVVVIYISGKTGGIDVRHFEGIWIGFKLGGELKDWKIEPTPFIMNSSPSHGLASWTDLMWEHEYRFTCTK